MLRVQSVAKKRWHGLESEGGPTTKKTQGYKYDVEENFLKGGK